MISIIVPVYNVEKYVKRCIESILEQTHKEFELIIVDDGSTDRSGEICDTLKKSDRRIRVIHQENGGLSAARNRGLTEAGGEYITYIDSDDYVDASYLETLYQNAVKYQADVSLCGFRLVWENSKTKNMSDGKDEVKQYTGREAVREIVVNNKSSMITAWGKLYHHTLRELLIYPEGRLHEDEFVTYKVLYQAKKVVETVEPLYNYFQRGKSIMNDGYSKRRLDKIVALKEAIGFFENKQEMGLMSYARKRYLLNIQIAWYRVKKFMPEEKAILTELNAEWKTLYKQNKADIVEKSSVVDKISIFVYGISPSMYCIIAEVVNKLFPYY